MQNPSVPRIYCTDVKPSLNSLVVCAAGLQHGLVGPAAAGDNPDHGAALGAHGLLGAGGEADLRGALVLVVRDDHGVVAGAAGECAAVADFGLHRRAHGSLGHGAQGEDVAHGEGRWFVSLSSSLLRKEGGGRGEGNGGVGRRGGAELVIKVLEGSVRRVSQEEFSNPCLTASFMSV